MDKILESTIRNLQKGDERAFKEIFDTFYERLYAFSFKYVKDKYAAEEVVENTMLLIWERRTQLNTIKDLKPYLYKTVYNASLDFLKNRKKVIPLDASVSDSISHFDKYVIEEETHSFLIKSLELLPIKCRRVFELCCIEGQKYKDVAEDLNISVNTVKSQRARAIELLKDQLKNSPYHFFILNIS